MKSQYLSIMDAAIDLALSEFNEFFMDPDPRRRKDRFLSYCRDMGVDHPTASAVCGGVFVSWVCKRLNRPCGTDDLRSWEHVGVSVKRPHPGDIVLLGSRDAAEVLERVGFFLEFSHDGTIGYCLGGRADGEVGVDVFEREQIIGFRRVKMEEDREIPQRHLKLGSVGSEVVKLQRLLTRWREPVMDPSGIFGFATLRALREFQASTGLPVDGEYTRSTAKAFQKTIEMGENVRKSVPVVSEMSRN